jgi:hypothetical protein
VAANFDNYPPIDLAGMSMAVAPIPKVIQP